MSIFLVSDISEKPHSYTGSLQNKEINYQSLKSEVRTQIIDKYNHFDKLGQQTNSPSDSKSPRRYQNAIRSLDVLFGKPIQNNQVELQSSPAKLSGLKKKVQSIGQQELPGKFTLPSGTQGFQSTFYDSVKKPSFLSPQQKNGSEKFNSFTTKLFSDKTSSSISNSISIQRLVEIQNLLQITPISELSQLPRNYLDELQRVSSSIQRNLQHHNNIHHNV